MKKLTAGFSRSKTTMKRMAKIFNQGVRSRAERFTIATLLILATVPPGIAQSPETTGRNIATHAADSAAQTNWPQVAFDNARTSFNPSEKILSRSTVHRLKRAWTFNLRGYVSGPAVVDGVAYTGSGDGHVYAIDVSTAKLLWKVLLDKSFDASWPTVVNSTVYVGTGVDHGLFYALNAKTGAVIWKFRPGGGVFNSPAVLNGRVYFGANDGDVYALDATTGKLVWTFSTGNLSSLLNPAVADGHVYITAGTPGGDTLYALKTSDGTLAWSFSATNDNGLGPAIVGDGKVYLGETDFPAGGFIYAFDAATGKNVWTLNLGDGGAGWFAFANGVVYTDSSDGTDAFMALDAATGRKLWGSLNSVALPVVATVSYTAFQNRGSLLL
jgi:outer membrane protein assembly factor BamB